MPSENGRLGCLHGAVEIDRFFEDGESALFNLYY